MKRLVKLTAIAAVIALMCALTLCLVACSPSDDILDEQFDNKAEGAALTDLDGKELKKISDAYGDDGNGIILTSSEAKPFSSVFISMSKSNIDRIKIEAKQGEKYECVYDNSKNGQNVFCDFGSRINSASLRITFFGGEWSLSSIAVYDIDASRNGTLIANVNDVNSGKIDADTLAITDSVVLSAAVKYNGEGKLIFTDCDKSEFISAVNALKSIKPNIKILVQLKTLYTPEIDQTDDVNFIRYNAMHYHRPEFVDNLNKFAEEFGISGAAIDMSKGMEETSALLLLSSTLKVLKEKNPDYTVFIMAGKIKDSSISMKISSFASAVFRDEESVADYADKLMFSCDKDGFFANVKKVSKLCEDSYREKVCVIADEFNGAHDLQDSYSYVNACGMSGAAELKTDKNND